MQYEPTLIPKQIPDSVKEASDLITKEIIKCEHERKCNDSCTGAFKITAAEFKFYKQQNIPLPILCPNCRYIKRLTQRSPMRLWKRQCCCGGTSDKSKKYNNLAKHFHGAEKCPNEFETSYSPDRPEIVYCEQCYQQEVA